MASVERFYAGCKVQTMLRSEQRALNSYNIYLSGVNKIYLVVREGSRGYTAR